LFGGETQQLTKLSQAVDDIRRRYGRDSIRRASFLDRSDEAPEPLSRKRDV